MRFSTVLVASASLLGLSIATPGEHPYYRRQAVSNTTSLLPTSAPTNTTSSAAPSSTSASTSPVATITLPQFVLEIQGPANGTLNSTVAKRQLVADGFVGLSAANALVEVSTIADAAVFASAGGELTVGGLNVFATLADIANPGYEALAVETVTGITTDVITVFGTDAAGALVWTNAAFTDGDAIFFLLDGALYASFTGTLPAGAVVVTLVPVTPSTTTPAVDISVTVNVSVTINISITLGISGDLGKLQPFSILPRFLN